MFVPVFVCVITCLCLRWFLPHQEKIHDEFLGKLKPAYKSVKIGDPLDVRHTRHNSQCCCEYTCCLLSGACVLCFLCQSSTLCGPLHTKDAVKQFAALIERAQQQGGKVTDEQLQLAMCLSFTWCLVPVFTSEPVVSLFHPVCWSLVLLFACAHCASAGGCGWKRLEQNR